MRFLASVLTILLLACGAASTPSAVLAQEATPLRTPKPLVPDTAYGQGPVFVVPLQGPIDGALARYTERAVQDAAEANAALIVFDVDTFGGLVDAADAMRQTLLDAPVPTLAFVDKNAASAGALISYAADRIVMVPGASIGAATVVQGGTGQAAPDKYQSYMRSLMRSTAEATGRDPRIAEAMVDPALEVDSVSAAGQVLTLSAQEAVRLGVADAIHPDVEAALNDAGLSQARLVEHRATRAERLLRFFAMPALQSLLMLMMMGGLYFELQTPGVGFAGAMAALGAALFFAPHYLLGLVESWELAVVLLGVLLLALELLVIPGVGVAGIAGLFLFVGGLLASLIPNVGFSFPSFEAVTPAVLTMAVTMVLLIALAYSIARYMPRSQRLSQLILVPELSSATGYTSAETDFELEGRRGRAVTPLRPAGTAEIDGRRVDVITAGEFVAAGAEVVVWDVRGSRVEVRLVPETTAEEG